MTDTEMQLRERMETDQTLQCAGSSPAMRTTFCDGSHKGTEVPSLKVEINETKTRPFCDGSHQHL